VALAAGYNRAVLATTLRVAKKLKKQVFQQSSLKLIGVDARACVYRFDAEAWRLVFKEISSCKTSEDASFSG